MPDVLWALLSVSHDPVHPARDFLYADYASRLERAGIRPVPVLNSITDFDSYFDELPIRALILTGGNDLSQEEFPALEADARNPAPLRDRAEKALIAGALARKLPILGICRGMQCLNAYFGGTLTRSLAVAGEHPHVRTVHEVQARNGGREIFATDQFSVNSYHEQAVRIGDLHPDLEPIAVSEGDVVEGLRHRELPIVGVQWHPERAGSTNAADDALFRYFHELARAGAGR